VARTQLPDRESKRPLPARAITTTSRASTVLSFGCFISVREQASGVALALVHG